MSPPSVVPWKPAITATLPASRAAWMRSAVMRLMRARVWPASVTMPICGPVNEQAGWPRDWSAIARRPIVTCSPVERIMSISRGPGGPGIAGARARSRWVVLPIAEPTTTTRCPRRADSATRRATFLIFSASATEEPPYFWTISRPMRGPSYTTRARSVKPTSARAAAGAAAVVVLRPDLARRRLPALPHLLAGLLALLGRHGAPPLEVAVEPRALLRRQPLEALVGRARGRRRRRRLGEGGDRDGEPQRRAHHEREQPGHFAPRGGDGGGGDDPGPGSFAASCACWLSSMRSRSKRPMRRATSRSRA